MTTTIDMRDLPARLEEAIALASAGGEVTLTDGPIVRARLVSARPITQRIAGLHVGAMETSADFDALLPDDYWIGRE